MARKPTPRETLKLQTAGTTAAATVDAAANPVVVSPATMSAAAPTPSRVLAAALGEVFAEVDVMLVAATANDAEAAQTGGDALLAAAISARAASTNIDLDIEGLIADRRTQRTKDMAELDDADRQVAERRDQQAKDVAALDEADRQLSDRREQQAKDAVSNDTRPSRRLPNLAFTAIGDLLGEVDELIAAGGGAAALAAIDDELGDILEFRQSMERAERSLRAKRAAIGGDQAKAGLVKCWTTQDVKKHGRVQPLGTELHVPLKTYDALLSIGAVTGIDPAAAKSEGAQ